MSIKDIYYKLEDKWYNILDGINNSVPVYGVIDKIDKVIPSFLLFLAVIVGLVFMLLGGFVFPHNYAFQISIADESGNAIQLADVIINDTKGEVSLKLQTDERGKIKETSLKEGKYTITVSKKGFKEEKENIELKANNTTEVLTLKESDLGIYTLSFKDTDGSPYIGRIDLTFQCSNLNVNPPEPKTIMTSTVKIEEPENCGLIITARTENATQTITLNPSIKTKSIMFEGESTKARLIVSVKENGIGIEGLIRIYDNGLQLERDYTETGTSSFMLEPGQYTVVFENTDYKRISSEIILSTNKTLELEAEPNPIGTIELEFQDSVTGNLIETNIYASLKLGNIIIGEEETSDGKLEFGIYKDTKHDLVVDAEGYCIKYVTGLEEGEYTIKLKKYENDCGGKLKVMIIDSERKPIANALVGLYNEDGVKLGFRDRTTDINGTAEFENILSGTYKAFARKGFSYGWSIAEIFSQRTPDKTKLIVSMETKKGNLTVNIKDIEGKEIQFAHIAFIDNFNELVNGGARPVEGTSYSIETQADKSVATIVTKEDYADYISYPELIVPLTAKTINAVLEKPTITGDLKIYYIGAYKGTEIASSLSPGEKYDLLFKIDIPKTKTYDFVGTHIRLGEKIRGDMDNIEIVNIEAPGQISIKKGSTYNPEKEDDEIEELVSGNSKWLSFEWNMRGDNQKFKRGNVYFKVKIKVKETAQLNNDLELNYRTWGYRDTLAKDPEDELNDDYTPSLYSKTYTKKLAVGGETLCSEDFCFSGTVIDLEENLGQSFSDTYNAKNYKDYSMSFNILNSGTSQYPNAEIKVSTDNIEIKDYSIYGGTNKGEQGNLGKNETNWISIGDLKKNQTINALLTLLTEKEGGNQIKIEIRSLQKIVYEKTIAFNVSAEKEMSAIIEPEFLASGTETELEITLKKDSLEIKDAKVYIRDKYQDIIASGTTNSMGYVKIRIPGQQPGEKLKIEARKVNYATFEKEIEVDDKVLEAPDNIGISINVLTANEGQKTITLKNRTIPLKIKEFRIKNADKRIVDLEAMEQWLNASYAGQEIEDDIDIVFKAYPRETDEPVGTTGTLIIILESDTILWEQEIPFNVSLTLGKGVDNPACLIINKQSLEFTTEGQPITLEYELRNDCTINDTPIAIKDIAGKSKWSGNELGTISVDAGASYNLSAYYQKFMTELGAGESTTVIVTFSPYGGITGTGEAELIFKALNATDKGNEEIIAQTDLDIKVANLKDCIVIDKPVLYILPDKQDTFTIEARGCTADLKLEIEGIEIDKKTVKLKENETAAITVFAGKSIPGQYNIKINGKTYAEADERYLNTVKARILHDCLNLSQYEFNIYDNPNKGNDGYQDAYLENTCYQKEVQLNLYWKEKDSLDIGKILLGGAVTYLGYDIYKNVKGEDSFTSNLFDLSKDNAENPNELTDSEKKALQRSKKYTNKKTGTEGVDKESADKLDAFIKSQKHSSANPKHTPEEMRDILRNYQNDNKSGKFSLAETSTGQFSFMPVLALAGIQILDKILNPNYDEGSQTITKIVKDNEITNIKLYDAQTLSSDITVEKLTIKSLTNKTERKYKNQEMELRFKNTGGIIQTEAEEPFVRILNILGNNYDYETDYKTSGSTDIPNINPSKTETFNQKFQLVFNAINPYEEKKQPQPIPNCVLGNKVGLTGAKAVPRIKYDWSWNDSVIDTDTCDTIDNYIYCDAVQFTIEIIKKMKELNEFLKNNQANFSCPIESGAAVSEQEIRTTAKDIALTRLVAEPKTDGTLLKLTMQSNNNIENSVTVLYQITGDLTRSFSRTYSVLSKETFNENISEMGNGEYEVTVTIEGIDLCETCLDEDETNNSISIEISKAGTGTRDCTRTMDRLYLFLDQAETEGKASWTNTEKEKIVGYANFLTHLMKDAYNQDMILDFDNYSKENSFFDTPSYYKQEGYDKLLKKIKFDYSGAPSALDAGIYEARMQIEFGDTWNIFSGSEPIIEPKIKLTRLDAPQPDNPFYYVPLDGEIGLDSDNGRQGYGVNFKQKSIEPVLFNSQTHDLTSIYRTGRGEYQAVLSYNNPSSNPISGGWVNIENNQEFAQQNNKERGIILDITKGTASIDIKFSPSYATPVLMEIEYLQGTKAYTMYSIEVDNTPQTTTGNLLKWNGVGVNCKDFEDFGMLDYWRETSDKHATANNLKCAPSSGITEYGVEWCSPTNTGKVYLQTVVFTPQDSRSTMQLRGSNGKAKLTSGASNTVSGQGDSVPLNGISRIPYNYTGNEIDSIDQIFDLVENNLVCVVGSGTNAKFFWNPKMILDSVYNETLKAENNCIQN